MKFKHSLIKLIYIAIDFVLIYLAIFLSCVIRHWTLPFDVNFHNLLFSPLNPYSFVFIFWIVTTILFINAKSLYQTKREVMETFEIMLLIRSVILSSILVILIIYSLKFEDFPRGVLIIGTGLIIVFLSTWRILKRAFVQYLVVRGYNNFNVIIVGAGRVGCALLEEIQKNPWLGFKVMGFLDDFKNDVPLKYNTQIIGKISQFSEIAKKEFIDKIFITIHHDSEVFLKLIEQAKELNIDMRVVPQGYDLVTGEFTKYNIGIIPILEYSNATPLRIQVGKRLFDFVISLASLLIMLPVFLCIAVLIRLDSPGPVFYISKRYGRNGRMFGMLKFRSMKANADKALDKIRGYNEVDGPIFKIKNDPRVTKMGKFLRKYSLDELPQFINVLKGEMSLVGPRPFPIEQIEKEDLKQLKRLEVRPGITGLWQIKGRSDLSFHRLIKWDIWYINNWSFWLDFNILLQTFPVVLKGKGAY